MDGADGPGAGSAAVPALTDVSRDELESKYTQVADSLARAQAELRLVKRKCVALVKERDTAGAERRVAVEEKDTALAELALQRSVAATAKQESARANQEVSAPREMPSSRSTPDHRSFAWPALALHPKAPSSPLVITPLPPAYRRVDGADEAARDVGGLCARARGERWRGTRSAAH